MVQSSKISSLEIQWNMDQGAVIFIWVHAIDILVYKFRSSSIWFIRREMRCFFSICVHFIHVSGLIHCMTSEDNFERYGQMEWHKAIANRIDGLVQDYSNSSALAMELLQSCTKPSNNEPYHKWIYALLNRYSFSYKSIPFKKALQNTYTDTERVICLLLILNKLYAFKGYYTIKRAVWEILSAILVDCGYIRLLCICYFGI